MSQIIKRILKTIKLCNSIKIYFVNPFYNPKDAEDFQVAKINTDPSVRKALKKVIQDICENLLDRRIINIDVVDKGDEDYLLTVNLKEVDTIHLILEQIKDEKFKTFNSHQSTKFLERLKFYIVEALINNETYYFIKRYSANKLLVPKQILMFYRENTFEHLEHSKVFALGSDFDALIKDDLIYIINEKQFTQMTGYYKKEKEKAKTFLTQIRGLNIIREFDELEEYCSNRISYMKRISKADPNVIKKITFEKILELQRQRGTDFKIDKKDKKVAFENTEQLKNLIDLILDNFVVSAVTGEQYRALNKLRENKKIG